MENSSYNPYVTERIRRFDGRITGACYSSPFINSGQNSHTSLNDRNIVSLHNQFFDETALIITPFQGNRLTDLLQTPENYSCLRSDNVRLAINYEALQQNGPALKSLAQDFSFWLYDVATPGTQWRNIEAFPFSGIVLTHVFFNENYLKFSFPFLLSAFREREAEVILRTPTLTLTDECYARLHISGWQEQRTSSDLFEV